MSAPDRDEEMLARLAEFDLAAAERVHGRLMAAEEPSELAELGRTYQRLARSLRQTLALKAKLKHDREEGAREAAREARSVKAGPVAIARREQELRAAVTRVIWNEAESPDHATELEEALEELITDGLRRDGFCAEPLDEHVAGVCLDLDLPLAAADRWRELPDPPETGDADSAPTRESSA